MIFHIVNTHVLLKSGKCLFICSGVKVLFNNELVPFKVLDMKYELGKILVDSFQNEQYKKKKSSIWN